MHAADFERVTLQASRMMDTHNSTLDAIKMETTADEHGNAEFSEDLPEKGSNNLTKDDTCTDRDGLFRCLDCGEAFEVEAIYLEHSLQHNLANSVVPKLDGLLSAKDVTRVTQTCTFCGLTFSNSNGLKDHLLNSHANRGEHVSHSSLGLPKQHMYNCQDCGKSYTAIGHFLNHRRSHKQASKSVFHELEQLKKKSFQCETCGRSYSRASALDAHRRCHEGKLIVKSRNRSAVEGFPPYDLVVGAENNTSEQTENVPEKLFDCSCGKAFYTMSRLKTHQRFSHNIKCSPEQLQEKNKEKIKKQFSCNECEKTFSSHVALNSHQRWHVNRSDEAGKKFPCEECGKAFMTLTFYYKHQRLAHSEETPAKSFLHQVCQLQKKSFQCKDCGLRFSRASALQSHQLCHTDVFKSSQVGSLKQTSPLPQKKVLRNSHEETQCFGLDEMGNTPNIHHIPLIAEDSIVNETDEDMEGYETGDFNVEVISASDCSVIDETEPTQDLNPDLELLCESDQEGKDDFDLKIVQIDFEQLEHQVTKDVFEANGDLTPVKRFNCPQCSSWFSTALSLRSHIMWHGTHQEKVHSDQHLTIYTCDICGFEASCQDTHSNHKQKHVNEKQSKIVLAHTAELEKKRFKCDECRKEFSRMSALISHRQHHPKRKPYPCPDCEMSYSHASGLYSHRKTYHSLKKLQDGVFSPKNNVFNPKKTLLGPKVFHCELCGKGFWSLGAYSHHKQNQAQCTDVQLKNNHTASLQPVNGHTRTNVPVACPVCGRKFRHKGVMKSHMRKHENGNHKCDLCDRSFRLLSSLFRHQVVHSAEVLPPPIKSFQYQVEQVQKNTYSCPDCGKRFSRAKALQFHMKSHGYETGFSPSSPKSAVEIEELQCSTCLAHFNNRSSLRAHQKLCGKQKTASQRHDEVTQSVSLKDNPILQCPKCLSLFNNVLSLQCHTKQCKQPVAAVRGLHFNKDVKDCLMKVTPSDKQPVRPTEDPEEGNLSEMDTQLHKNKLVSLTTADLKYKCKECERSFKVVGALNFHKRVHLLSHKSKKKTKLHVSPMLKRPKQKEHTRGPFFCTDCGRRFTSNAALGTHRRWHTDKKFAGSLKKNERTNSIKSVNEGPFHCNKCGKGFFYLCVLRRHQLYYPPCQTKADQEPDIDTTAHSSKFHTEFSCPKCIKTFVRGSLLAAHYESEHSKSLESAGFDHGHNQVQFPSDEAPTKEDLSPVKFKTVKKSKLRSSIFPCPHCNKAFSKIRGLRAHKWQAHSKSVMGQSKSPTNKVRGRVAQNSAAIIQGEIVTQNNNPSMKTKNSLAKKRSATIKEKNKVRFASLQLKPFPCLDCGKQYSSAGALHNHRKMCIGLKQEKKATETVTKEPSPVNRLQEQNIKCLYKCDKCGKAFPTEKQLGAHKDLAKKLPFCCALCCRGYWTESQLQQHLVWHDEVRCRLPTELRYRLSASLTKPTKADLPLSDKKVNSFLESPTVSSATRSQNSHKCKHCGKAFLSPAALQKHEAQHNTLHSYRCSLCPRTFGEIRDLIDHHQECMGDDKGQSNARATLSEGDTLSLTCIECGISFVQEIELHQHYIEHARGAY